MKTAKTISDKGGFFRFTNRLIDAYAQILNDRKTTAKESTQAQAKLHEIAQVCPDIYCPAKAWAVLTNPHDFAK